jgi:hypothetical protein
MNRCAFTTVTGRRSAPHCYREVPAYASRTSSRREARLHYIIKQAKSLLVGRCAIPMTKWCASRCTARACEVVRRLAA